MSRFLPAARRSAAALILAALIPAAVAAQPPPDSTAAPAPPDSVAAAPPSPREVTMLQGGAMGELLSIYVPRSEAEIQTSMGFARDLAVSNEREIQTNRRLAMEAEGRLRVIKEELETTKVRRDVAKKAKDEAQKGQLDEVVKRQERERDYLQRLHDAMRADTERLDAERLAAETWVKSLEEESLVARRHAEIGAREPSPAEAADYRSRLRRMLDTQKQAAERWGKASDLRKLVAERRIKQLEAQSKLTR
jgi:hypothetical protein